MEYKTNPVGNEISCVFHNVSNEILNNHRLIKGSLIEALKKEGFTILDISSHEFSPQGFSFCALIAESHATIHTYPEYNSLAFHLYSCRSPNDGQIVLKHLKEKLKPERIKLATKKVIVDPNFKT
ncbi:MAG: adenosylmethionine decarboxylase [Nanoarchaeota archaeon]